MSPGHSLSTGATSEPSCAMPLSQANNYREKTPSAKLSKGACKFVGDNGIINVQSRSREMHMQQNGAW